VFDFIFTKKLSGLFINSSTMKNIFLIIIGSFFCNCIFAQDSSINKNKLTISAYAELYYSYDFNNPQNNTKPGFIYNFNRNNEVNLNLGFIKASYNSENVRANLSIAAGTYMNAAYSSEPGTLKNIFEANAGIKISKKNNMWIDAGIFSSHIGSESAVGATSWNLTRSIVAENTPYYESGVKFSYTSKNNIWLLSALFLNGWQHIARPNSNTSPAFGTQVTFTPSANFSLNYSTFIGNDKPDSIKQERYYNNLYAIFQCTKSLALQLGFDYGLQQKAKGSSSFNNLFAPLILLRFTSGNNNIVARAEYYSDPNEIIVQSGTPNGFKIFGWSINYDRQITSKIMWRIEARNLVGKDNYFSDHNNNTSNNSTFLTTSIAVSF